MYNGDKMFVIEVTYKLHPNGVQDFVNRKLPTFKLLFNEYADREIIGGLSGMSVPVDSYELAQENGLLVLTQSGENIQVMNPKGTELRYF